MVSEAWGESVRHLTSYVKEEDVIILTCDPKLLNYYLRKYEQDLYLDKKHSPCKSEYKIKKELYMLKDVRGIRVVIIENHTKIKDELSNL